MNVLRKKASDGVCNRDITCVVCPWGCNIKVTLQECNVIEIRGNRCSRGADYASQECVSPMRNFTSVVRVEKGLLQMAPVKTDKPIPKEMLRACILEINKYHIHPPVKVGDVIIENILDTGSNIIATRNID